MRLSLVARSLVSGVIVYVLAAACGSSDRVAAVMADGSTASVGDVVVDAIAHSEGEASAAPNAPDVAEEACNKSMAGAGGTTYLFAVHAYPGKSVVDLSSLRVVLHLKDTLHPIIDGQTFDSIAGSAYLRDGSAAVLCGMPVGQSYDEVTFILPR